jgi:DNA-binding protein HU-beta
VIDGTIDVILATVAKGEDVTLTGFAKLSKVKRAARIGRNPQTGAPVKIKAKTVAKITALKGFKDVVLGVTPAPKLAGVKKAAAGRKAPAATAAAAKKSSPAAATKSTAPRAAATKKAAAAPVAKSTKKR